jgi:hypothetical protein
VQNPVPFCTSFSGTNAVPMLHCEWRCPC